MARSSSGMQATHRRLFRARRGSCACGSYSPTMLPVGHVQDAVRIEIHLGHLVGDQQDGEAFRGELPHDLEDAGAGADVDADGRTVEDQELRFGRQPFGDRDALLIAAREGRDRDPPARPTLIARSSIQRGDQRLLLARRDQPALRGSCRERSRRDCRRSIAAE